MTTGKSRTGSDVLAWEIRLWEQNPSRRYLLVAISLAVGAFSAVAFDHILLGILAFLFLMGSTMEFWYPVRFRLDSDGAQARVGISVTAIRWEEVRRVVEGEDGYKLSPLEKAGRTAPFRGVYIRCGENRGEVLEFIRRSVSKDAAILGRGTDGGADGEAANEGR